MFFGCGLKKSNQTPRGAPRPSCLSLQLCRCQDSRPKGLPVTLEVTRDDHESELRPCAVAPAAAGASPAGTLQEAARGGLRTGREMTRDRKSTAQAICRSVSSGITQSPCAGKGLSRLSGGVRGSLPASLSAHSFIIRESSGTRRGLLYSLPRARLLPRSELRERLMARRLRAASGSPGALKKGPFAGQVLLSGYFIIA